MADDNTSDRGLGSPNMDEDTKHKIQSAGGKASGGQFKSGDERTSKAGKKGAEAQPTEAKRRGGKNSHSNQ
jgi:general stress protein YciG